MKTASFRTFERHSDFTPAAAMLRARSASWSAARPAPTTTMSGSPWCAVTPYGRAAPVCPFAMRSTTVFTERGSPAGVPPSLLSGTMTAST